MNFRDNKEPNVLTSSFQVKLVVQEAVSHYHVFPSFDISPDELFVEHMIQSFLELAKWCSQILHNSEESKVFFLSLLPVSDMQSCH